MDFIKYALGAALIWFVLSKVYEGYKSAGDDGRKHCMTCGTDGTPKTVTKGSILIEIVLWLCLIVPGLIYSIWRLTTRGEACAACASTAIVPLDSPAAVNHRRALTPPTASPA